MSFVLDPLPPALQRGRLWFWETRVYEFWRRKNTVAAAVTI